MPTTTSRVIHARRFVLVMFVLGLLAATLSSAPKAKAWSTFTEWYGNRTANSVTVYWTVRAQEDSPSTPAEQAHICWTTHPTFYPCDSQGTYLNQWLPVGSVNSYTITGLACNTAYRVMIGQPYIVSANWDWDEHTISIPAYGSCPAPGPLLWLRADSIWQSSGSKVSFWADQSGNGRNASMSTVARQPTLITGALNSLPVVRFGGAQSLVLSSAVSPQQFTVFIVGKNSHAPQSASMILGVSGGSGTPNNQLRWDSSSNVLFVRNASSTVSAFGSTTVYHVLSVRFDGSTITFYRNGNLMHSAPLSSGSPWSINQVGGWFSSYYMIGDLAEVLMYDTGLSETDRTATDNYLRTKYALP